MCYRTASSACQLDGSLTVCDADQEYLVDPGFLFKGLTSAASPSAGCSRNCVPNAKRVWQLIFDLSESDAGIDRLQRALRLCPEYLYLEDNSTLGVIVANWAARAFISLVGNVIRV